MKKLQPVNPRKCNICDVIFTPKDGGYTAKYCSSRCKDKQTRSKYTTLQKKTWRRNSWVKTKSDPEKLQKHHNSNCKSLRKSRQWLADYKVSRGCKDCGYNKHPAALQLDHEGSKSIDFADCRSSINRMKQEIELGRCVVRCAVCHSVKTWADKNKIDYTPEMAR